MFLVTVKIGTEVKYLRRSGIGADKKHSRYEFGFGPGFGTRFSTKTRAALAINDARLAGVKHTMKVVLA